MPWIYKSRIQHIPNLLQSKKVESRLDGAKEGFFTINKERGNDLWVKWILICFQIGIKFYIIGFWLYSDLSRGVGESIIVAGEYGSQSSCLISSQVGDVSGMMVKKFMFLKAHAQ